MTDLRTWLADMLVCIRQSASRHELPSLTGEHRIEARRSVLTLRDGVVVACEDRVGDGSPRGLLGMALVGWVTIERGRRVVSHAWKPNARALLWSNSRSSVGVTSPSFAFVPAHATSHAFRSRAPSLVPLPPQSMTRVDLATAV